MKKNTNRFIISFVLLSIVTTANAQLTINTSAIPPVSSFLNQIFSQAGTGVRARLNYTMVDSSLMNPNVRVSVRIQRLSPSPFTIELKNDSLLGAFIYMTQMSQHMLTKSELEQAFGNFNDANLTYTGITPGEINGKLPDGVYNICFTAQARKYQKNVSPNCCIADGIDPCVCPDRCGCWNQNQYYEVIKFACTNFTIVTCTQPQNGMLITTIATPPINPIISQSISVGNVKSSIQFTNPPTCSTQVRLYGKIQRISPSPLQSN